MQRRRHLRNSNQRKVADPENKGDKAPLHREVGLSDLNFGALFDSLSGMCSVYALLELPGIEASRGS